MILILTFVYLPRDVLLQSQSFIVCCSTRIDSIEGFYTGDILWMPVVGKLAGPLGHSPLLWDNDSRSLQSRGGEEFLRNTDPLAVDSKSRVNTKFQKKFRV